MDRRKMWVLSRFALILTFAAGLGLAAFGQGFDDLDDLESLFADDEPAASSSGSSPTPPGGVRADDDPGVRASDGFDIDALFGVFKEEEPAAPVEPGRVLPPFTGNYRILVGRPVWGTFEAERNTQWISTLGELFTMYKVASFPRTHVFSMDQVNIVLPNYRDFSRRMGIEHLKQAARRLGATHLLHQEYQPAPGGGRRTRYSMELFWLEENATVIKFAADIDHARFEEGLHGVLSEIAKAIDEGARGTPAFNSTVWGRDQRALEQFGAVLANEGSFSKDNAASAYAAADRMITRNAANVGFHYAGALLAGRAEQYAKAVHHLEAVIVKSREYPALQLRLAELLRESGRYSEAMTAAETASRNPALRVPASIEMAAIHQSQGNLSRAKSEYDALVSSGDADGHVFFRLALLSIQAGSVSESQEYLRRSGESGFALDEDQYFELGRAYAKAGRGFETQALSLLERSLGVRQNREEAWEMIAEVYGNMGNEPQQAEAYVNMFKLNPQANSARLKQAGVIYERIGLTDKARDAYALFLDRRFSDRDVSMSLARIYYNERNCRRLPEVLKGYDTIPEAAEMLAECGIRRRVVNEDQVMRTQKLSPVMLTLRIGSGVIAAGGLAGALALDLAVLPDQVEKYGSYPGNPDRNPVDPDAMSFTEVQSLRKSIDSNIMLRNVLYIAAGVGIAGFAVTYFF